MKMNKMTHDFLDLLNSCSALSAYQETATSQSEAKAEAISAKIAIKHNEYIVARTGLKRSSSTVNRLSCRSSDTAKVNTG